MVAPGVAGVVRLSFVYHPSKVHPASVGSGNGLGKVFTIALAIAVP